MNRQEFIHILIRKGKIDNEIIQQSKNLDNFPECYSILLAVKDSVFINSILSPKEFGEIDLAAGNLKLFSLQEKKEIKQSALKFIDDLVKISKNEFNTASPNISQIEFKDDSKKRKITLGIDLGTTNTVAAFFEKDRASTISLKNGKRILPSVVSVNKKKRFDVGDSALRQLIANPEDTFYSIKRLIGRRPNEFNETFLNNFSFNIDSNDQKLMLKSSRLGRNLECEEISAQVLMKIKKESEERLNATINECVITVPAYFDNNQRAATRNAAKIAGMNIKRIINEPTAAAFAYELEKKGGDSNTLVLDLGGGTFDISLVKSVGENLDNFNVVSTLGDRDLGGDDFTDVIYEMIIKSLKRENKNIDFNINTRTYIREEANKAKHFLSNETELEIQFPFLPTKSEQSISSSFLLTRKDFENQSQKLINKIKKIIKNFLNLKKVKHQKIDKAVLVGGASRMNFFREIVFETCKIKTEIDINPDEVVAQGAAYCAEYLDSVENPKLIIDVNPLSLGTEIINNDNEETYSELIPSNIPLPVRKSEVFTTKEDFQKNISIKVLQGGTKKINKNILLGKYVLDGIKIDFAGKPQCKITYELDEDGLLKVTAIDEETLSKLNIQIKNVLDLSKEKIEEMKNLAEEMAT